MGSKSKSALASAAPLNDIVQPLNNALRQMAGRRDLVMNEIDRLSTSRVLYALTGTGAVPAETDRKCILHQLFPKTKPELWLGILLELRKTAADTKYEIVHVSIQVFEGATSQTIEPLLRAEWDPVVSRSRNGPAQPHWHSYSGRTSAAREFDHEGVQEFGTMTGSYESIKQRQHKVHFALCANWHKGGSHFELLNTPAELNRWILGVLDYVRSQV